MTDRNDAVDQVRRRLLKASALGGSSLALGLLPYEKPAVKSFFGTRQAYAQLTTFTEIRVQPPPDGSGQLGITPPGTPEDTGQDCYEFGVTEPSTELTVTVTPDASLDVEIYLYGPGASPPFLGQTNLLNNVPLGLNDAGVGAAESATVTVAAAGTYTVAVEDPRTPFDQVAGTYTIVITSDKPITDFVQVCDEGPESESVARL